MFSIINKKMLGPDAEIITATNFNKYAFVV